MGAAPEINLGKRKAGSHVNPRFGPIATDEARAEVTAISLPLRPA